MKPGFSTGVCIETPKVSWFFKMGPEVHESQVKMIFVNRWSFATKRCLLFAYLRVGELFFSPLFLFVNFGL